MWDGYSGGGTGSEMRNRLMVFCRGDSHWGLDNIDYSPGCCGQWKMLPLCIVLHCGGVISGSLKKIMFTLLLC